MRKIGYARVSTDGQDLSAQREALRECSVVYAEKISGARADRPQLRAMIAALGQGDIVVVTRLDRLARSTRDLLNVLAEITAKGAAFRSIADTWADTTTPHGRLMITVLGGLAEFERELILARTAEGKQRAVARGVKFGRKSKLTPHQRGLVLDRKAAGDMVRDIARDLGVSHSTISRMQ
jgi:DNA invertase Pin-like site-specific DNA recombinase